MTAITVFFSEGFHIPIFYITKTDRNNLNADDEYAEKVFPRI